MIPARLPSWTANVWSARPGAPSALRLDARRSRNLGLSCRGSRVYFSRCHDPCGPPGWWPQADTAATAPVSQTCPGLAVSLAGANPISGLVAFAVFSILIAWSICCTRHALLRAALHLPNLTPPAPDPGHPGRSLDDFRIADAARLRGQRRCKNQPGNSEAARDHEPLASCHSRQSA